MGVVIRLQRAGARNRPFYRVVVADSRKPRDGGFIEKVGYYDPVPIKDIIQLDRERINEWMGKGAKPSSAVLGLMRRLQRRGTAAAPPAAQPPQTVPSAPEPVTEPLGSTGQDETKEDTAQPKA
jgi:small subunit ribosomal protein S16